MYTSYDRDTARVLAMEALGHEVRCISKVSTPGESDSERSRRLVFWGGGARTKRNIRAGFIQTPPPPARRSFFRFIGSIITHKFFSFSHANCSTMYVSIT